jgi:hypothetical protein
MPNVLQVAKLTADKERALANHLDERILAIESGSKDLWQNKYPKWRSGYDALPREEVRMFPFQNASNLVIPIIAIHADTLHARIMSGIFKTDPLFQAAVYGKWTTEDEVGELKEALQEYLKYVGIEPQELDLYRVYNEGYLECIKYGTMTIKVPWEKKFRSMLITTGTGDMMVPYAAKSGDFIRETVYEGPRPEKLPFDAFGIPASSKCLEDADIKYHRRVTLKHELMERRFSEVYDKAKVDAILNQQDRNHPRQTQAQTQKDAGITAGSPAQPEWDIYECMVQWRYNDDAFAPKMIVSYHKKSRTILRVLYDNFKDEWFVGARLGRRDDMYHGMGFAEILWYFQEEASEKHNGRNDNQTVANTRVWRVSPESKLHQGYRIYPSAMLPAEKDEIEPMAHGEISSTNMDEERLTLELAERRSGVSPPQQGFGAGTMSGKRGVYSAMGTLSLLQEGNRRSDLTLSDIRDAHVRLGRIITRQYHEFSGGSKFCEERFKLFGERAATIKKALQLLVERKMGIPVFASSASVNKEVEKQNDIMLSQIVAKHYSMVSQLLMQLNQGAIPPQVKEYSLQIIDASNYLMKGILKHFDHDDVDRLIPDPLKKIRGAVQSGQQPNGQQQNPQAQAQSAGNPSQPPQLPPAMVGDGGGPPIQ